MQNSHQLSEVKVMLARGVQGKGIASIVKTSTSGLVDTYTITYDDGSKTTFNVTNGSSIASIDKTGTVGLVDTYTITMTDGTIGGTFEVTNGQDGEQLITTTFTILSSDWTANAGTDAADFPYVCEISSALYSNTYVPAEVLLLGSDPSDYPTSTEQEAIQSVDQYIKFTASGVRLRAATAPSVTLTLVVRG
jgi:hypothetical protein